MSVPTVTLNNGVQMPLLGFGVFLRGVILPVACLAVLHSHGGKRNCRKISDCVAEPDHLLQHRGAHEGGGIPSLFLQNSGERAR